MGMGRPDYALDAVLELTTPAQFKALGDPLRQKALGLLAERAATTGELAAALRCPTSTMAHHLHVLERAGLIRVVRVRQVRAVTERYYGRTARTYLSISGDLAEAATFGALRLRQELAEAGTSPVDAYFPSYMFGHARLPAEQARAFAERVRRLVEEFNGATVPGEPVYGFVAALYRTDWPELPTVQE